MANRSFTLRTVVVSASLSLLAATVSGAPGDYPTAVLADYVYGCLKANGETQVALQKCSCSIDVVASLLPYDRYVGAETVLSLRQMTGERSALFRSSEPARAAVDDLRRAQAEAEVRCF
jgi:hypothetical protein